jgi:potassium-transporting ATPase KdpC subunit
VHHGFGSGLNQTKGFHMSNTHASTSVSETQEGLLRPALFLFVALSLVTGLAYPFLVTGAAQSLFPKMANGQLIEKNGQVVGSELIGQSFTEPKYFWGRPSATAPMSHNASASGGSNLGPSNPALLEAVKGRVESLHAADPSNKAPIPVDLVTASASGLDPHISQAAADYQLARVAKTRHLSQEQLKALVEQHTHGAFLGFIGEPRVNVLTLNLALDDLPSLR